MCVHLRVGWGHILLFSKSVIKHWHNILAKMLQVYDPYVLLRGIPFSSYSAGMLGDEDGFIGESKIESAGDSHSWILQVRLIQN